MDNYTIVGYDSVTGLPIRQYPTIQNKIMSMIERSLDPLCSLNCSCIPRNHLTDILTTVK